jgi:hypothetical protein
LDLLWLDLLGLALLGMGLLGLAELALVRRGAGSGPTVVRPGRAVPVPLLTQVLRIVVPAMRKAHRHSIPHDKVV